MVKASYGLNGERAAGDTLVLSLCSISIVYEAVRLGYRRTKKDGLMVEIAKQEDELRREFYESYLPRVNRELSIDNVLTDYSDGILNGNIIEYKEYVSDLNNVLLQALNFRPNSCCGKRTKETISVSLPKSVALYKLFS